MRPLCPSCRQPVDETDCFCRYCGHTLQPRMGFWYSHGGILLMTLLAGPFALPFVWLSHKISRNSKWFWTAIILVVTWYLCYSMYQLYHTLTSVLTAF